MGVIALFFFSSRRRHTRCGRDWSSDVCSSDLQKSWGHGMLFPERASRRLNVHDRKTGNERGGHPFDAWMPLKVQTGRSEERRVGKECRGRWLPDEEGEKMVKEERKGEVAHGTE